MKKGDWVHEHNVYDDFEEINQQRRSYYRSMAPDALDYTVQRIASAALSYLAFGETLRASSALGGLMILSALFWGFLCHDKPAGTEEAAGERRTKAE